MKPQHSIELALNAYEDKSLSVTPSRPDFTCGWACISILSDSILPVNKSTSHALDSFQIKLYAASYGVYLQEVPDYEVSFTGLGIGTFLVLTYIIQDLKHVPHWYVLRLTPEQATVLDPAHHKPQIFSHHDLPPRYASDNLLIFRAFNVNSL
jgi:hypothetical protein